MVEEQFLTFDDVLITPAFSDVESRQDIDTSIDVWNRTLKIPIISANMDFVTGADMAIAMHSLGGMGILHRFWDSQEDYLAAIRQVASTDTPVWISVGIRDIYTTETFIKKVVQEIPIEGICIDVAHGHHQKVADLIELIKGNINEEISNLFVIAGNVATPDGVTFLRDSGADGVKIGIGAGSVCTTRTVAGVGVPQWSAILECCALKFDYPELTFIADGGVRSSGDIAKAIGAGADLVMLGNMLSGTDEAPGEIISRAEWEYPLSEPKKYKRYRGQASFGSNGDRYVKEGIEGVVPYKGPVEKIIQDIKAGLQSSMSYVGAHTLEEFQENAKFVVVSSHTLMENNTRVREHYG